MGCGRAVLGGVLVASAGSQLHDSVDANVKEFEILVVDALRHSPTHFLHQYPQTAVLREREVVGTNALLPIKGPQCTDGGSEFVGG